MIVVVEGISAAGKTSWCRAHAVGHVVEEAAPSGPVPDRGSAVAAWTAFWIDRNARRWLQAREMSARTGLAVCDTDPLKLHYNFGLWRIGIISGKEWVVARDLTAEAIAEGMLGFADLFLVRSIAPDQARLQRDADSSRSRRSFDLHVRLGRPLEQWYRAVEALLPGRVIWEWPADGVPTVDAAGKPADSDIFEALMERVDR